MTFRMILFALAIFSLAACSDNPTPAATAQEDTATEAPAPETFSEKVETAHHKTDFLEHAAIQFDLQLFFGGTERLNGTLTLSTDSRQGLIATKDGKKIYYQYDKVFFAPETTNVKGTRFSAYTWSYFFLLPYKLNDGGTVWSDYPDKTLNGEPYLTGKLSFTPGTGDAPDDWYIVYADTETLLTEVAAYIVTAGKSQAEAEEDPHAIQYLDYQKVDGIPIATQWKFWGWQADQGLTDQLGEATISNISFVEPAADFFTPPADFIEG